MQRPEKPFCSKVDTLDKIPSKLERLLYQEPPVRGVSVAAPV